MYGYLRGCEISNIALLTYHLLFLTKVPPNSNNMSGSLDQMMVEDIARNCPEQFHAFHKCMSKPPSEADCLLEQENLSRCVKTKVPLFQKIQNTCAGKLQGYEACLRLNGGDPKKCQSDLDTLRACALSVAGQ